MRAASPSAAATPTIRTRARSVARVPAPTPQRWTRNTRSQAGQSTGLTSTRQNAKRSRTAARSASGRSASTLTLSPRDSHARAMGAKHAVTRARIAIGDVPA